MTKLVLQRVLVGSSLLSQYIVYTGHSCINGLDNLSLIYKGYKLNSL